MNQSTPVVNAMARKQIHFPMELDKIPGFWVVTGWIEDVVLRIRVQHSSSEEPCELCCEIRLHGEPEFRVLTNHETSLWSLVHEDEDYRADVKNFPQVWRSRFREMARRWAASTWIIEFGNSSCTRYAGEPESSRDCFETGEYAT